MTTTDSRKALDESTDPLRYSLIDCDIHNRIGMDTIHRYMSPRWQRQVDIGGMMRMASETLYYVRPRMMASRTDAFTPDGKPPGTDPAFLSEHHLDTWNIDIGILNPSEMMPLGSQQPELAAAITQAMNENTLAEWLEPEPRLRASICIPWEDPQLAVAELRKWAADPRFIQVLGNVRHWQPLGTRKYWPIYEAAEELGLPIGFHVGGMSGHSLTGAGFPSYYFEDHSGYAQGFHAQAISMAVEGVFEHFPTLKVVWMEGGFSWVAPLGWRLDNAWSQLRDEVPFLKRPPSEYMREHFWYTTQPIEEPPDTRFLVEAYNQLGLAERLLFSTDYPHWDFDAPDTAFPPSVPAEHRDLIFSRNAANLYGF